MFLLSLTISFSVFSTSFSYFLETILIIDDSSEVSWLSGSGADDITDETPDSGLFDIVPKGSTILPEERDVLNFWIRACWSNLMMSSEPLRMYSLSDIGVMRSSSVRSCHTYSLLYFLLFVEFRWKIQAYIYFDKYLFLY